MVFILYWFENVAIGFFNVGQILGFGLKRIVIHKDTPLSFLGVLFVAAFFTVHYGLFTLGHGSMIFALFGGGEFADYSSMPSLQQIVQAFIDHNLGWAALSIFLAAGLSAFIKFPQHTGSQMDARIIMFAPYGRIIVLHVGLLIGGLIATWLGSPVWALILLILLKSTYDLLAIDLTPEKMLGEAK